jgi:hypothetical protein
MEASRGPRHSRDSFTLGSASTVTQIQAAIWVEQGGTPTTVDWSISTTPFGADVTSPFGTNLAFGLGAVLSNTLVKSAYFGSDLYESTFSLPNVLLGSGTYYLTLRNATASNSTFVAWDINNGPSTAYEFPSFTTGTENGFLLGSNSDSFQVYGPDVASTPEPASMTLLGLGVAGMAGYGWRRRKQAVAA